jgi:hypothetical protein
MARTTTRTTPTPRNPATTVSPATGKRQGPPRKPLATTVVGSMGTRTTTPTRPASKRGAAATAVAAKRDKATAVAHPATKPNTKATSVVRTPASRALPRNLLVAVATWASQAKLSPADQQRVANYLKVVTSGTDAQGARYWPTAADLPKGVRPLPRPTHHSWAAR